MSVGGVFTRLSVGAPHRGIMRRVVTSTNARWGAQGRPYRFRIPPKLSDGVLFRNLFIAKTTKIVVIDQTNSLHESIADR